MLLTLFGCNGGPNNSTSSSPHGAVTELRFALVPSDDTEQMMAGFDKLRAYLEKTLGMPVTVVQTTSYAACIEAMKKGRVDVAWLGPTSYIIAEQEADAEAFMVSVDSKGITTYNSLILVPANSTAKTLMDLKGKKIAFVEASSTSGGLVPSYMIYKASGMPAEKFANITYAGNHDAVVNVVKEGTVDGGATNNLTLDRMLSQGKVTKDQVRILVQSDPIPGSPMVWRKDLPEDLRTKLSDAIIASPKALGTYSIAGFGEIASFKKTSPADYQIIRDMATKLNVSRDDLLK
jgi:phosphonate transport system substrate-binding protein